ncbi:hypothetical protein SASPL_113489 [Salvia splendens]|uniref:Uncharacterized protein n=1 Tax=Salvia splendens TaxID=180675 RepID=A0A8X8XZ03_SALSN|nr:uncharacterized protein LOC121805204 [Salvia splendens]KAG6423105.1 hypothetical protein SASPL_113489 [Salvia splendens]
MISRKHRTLEEATKMAMHTPISSVKSSLTVDSSNTPSESRDLFYFPGCKKDANCKCEICIASINATLDLMTQSSNRSSFRKSYAPRTFTSRSPIYFNSFSANLSTPKLSARTMTPVAASPPPSSNETISRHKEDKRRKDDLGYGVFSLRILWCLSLILVLGAEYGASWVVSGIARARLSPDFVNNLGLKSGVYENLSGRFVFLKNELEGLVGGDVSSCSSVDHSLWRINQDGRLLTSRCVLYESMIEEVSIWGWPLPTAGLLAAEYSTRSYTVITGRVREWSNGGAEYLVREAGNSSWTQQKWSTSVVQLESNTWILEYRRSFIGHNPKLVSAAVEFLRFKLTSQFKKMKREFWLAPAFGGQNSEDRRGRIVPPT